MRNWQRVGVLGALVLCGAPGVLRAYETVRVPSEARAWDEAKAFNGYTLFAGRGVSYLVDMQGRLVHRWPLGTNPHLLDNGHLLDAATDDPSGFAGFKEIDWDGTAVWEYRETRTGYAPHHDFTRIFNPALDTRYFPRSPAEYWWSADTRRMTRPGSG